MILFGQIRYNQFRIQPIDMLVVSSSSCRTRYYPRWLFRIQPDLEESHIYNKEDLHDRWPQLLLSGHALWLEENQSYLSKDDEQILHKVYQRQH